MEFGGYDGLVTWPPISKRPLEEGRHVENASWLVDWDTAWGWEVDRSELGLYPVAVLNWYFYITVGCRCDGNYTSNGACQSPHWSIHYCQTAGQKLPRYFSWYLDFFRGILKLFFIPQIFAAPLTIFRATPVVQAEVSPTTTVSEYEG